MKILTNQKIKSLFCHVLLLMISSALLQAILINLAPKHALLYVMTCSLCTSIFTLAVLYCYFKEQNKIMEEAVMQIREYISGNHSASLSCNEEGELYRLFHEVNSLVSILNAHAEKEKHAKKFLKNTISDISHQLKTPLAALNIYNGILQEEAKSLPTASEFKEFREFKEFIMLSEKELDRIETLVQNLLKITKFDAGTVIMEKNEENISDMMADIERQFSYRARQEEKNFILAGDDSISLLCDHSWLPEAIGNIVKNAFDHTKKGNTISIEWKESASAIRIIIKDNGSGIHPDDLYYIFKRFYRSRYSKDTQGIGLGLSLAKSIIEAHNGTIEVDSEPGAGTTFYINFLPLA